LEDGHPYIADLRYDNNVQELGDDKNPCLGKRTNEWCHCLREGTKNFYQIKVWRNEDDPVKVLHVTTACDETMDRYFCQVQKSLPPQQQLDNDEDDEDEVDDDVDEIHLIDDDDEFRLIDLRPANESDVQAMVDWFLQQM
jgi:hypothetical protein